MNIALDYDGTYTRDPEMWDKFIILAEKMGHEVVCLTMRHPSEPVAMKIPIRIIYTARKAKALFYNADIWIDDMPQLLFADAA